MNIELKSGDRMYFKIKGVTIGSFINCTDEVITATIENAGNIHISIQVGWTLSQFFADNIQICNNKEELLQEVTL